MAALLAATTTRPPKSLTRAKQQAFLDALRQCGNQKKAAEFVGIDVATPWRWVHNNAQFAEKMATAQAEGERALLLAYEQSLDAKILPSGKELTLKAFVQTQYLRMFRMKRLDPRYRDNATVNVAASGPVAIMLGVEVEAASEKSPTPLLGQKPVD